MKQLMEKTKTKYGPGEVKKYAGVDVRGEIEAECK